MGVPRAITVLRDRFGVAPRGKLRDLIKEKLSSRQLDMVDIIESEALKDGLSLAAAAAMVTNSIHESGLNPLIIQKESRAGYPPLPIESTGVGLFQLTGPIKSRKGTFAQRQDPIFNTQYMLWELRGPTGQAFLKAAAEGAGVDSLAGIFARDIERCLYCGVSWSGGRKNRVKDNGSSQVRGRSAYARKIFPTLPHTGDIDVYQEAKPHHGGAWSTSKPPDIKYTPAPPPERNTYEVAPRTPAPLPPILTAPPAPVTAPSSVDTVLVAPAPISDPAPEEPTSVATVARSLSLTPEQLLGIGVASAVVATFAGVLIVRSRRLEAARPLSYSGAR